MSRIMAVDYGTKRVGLAVTDPLKIIATALETVHSSEAVAYIRAYSVKEPLERIVVGLPVQNDGSPSDSERHIKAFISHLEKELPGIPIVRYDERFTSVLAGRTMLEAGYKKKQRQDKKRLDSISATIILQGYLQSVQ